jgi:acetate kinase
MANDGPERIVLARDSGSSSLKFGLYRLGTARTETLLSGEAVALGDTGGKFDARDTWMPTAIPAFLLAARRL